MGFSKFVSNVFSSSKHHTRNQGQPDPAGPSNPPRRPRTSSQAPNSYKDEWQTDYEPAWVLEDQPSSHQPSHQPPHQQHPDARRHRRDRKNRRKDDMSFANFTAVRRRQRHDPSLHDDVPEWHSRPALALRSRFDARHDPPSPFPPRRPDADTYSARHPDKEDDPPSRRMNAWRTRSTRVKSNLEDSHRIQQQTGPSTFTRYRRDSSEAPDSDSSPSFRRLLVGAIPTFANRERSRLQRRENHRCVSQASTHDPNDPVAVVGTTRHGQRERVQTPREKSTLLNDYRSSLEHPTARRPLFPTGRRIRSNIDHFIHREHATEKRPPVQPTHPSTTPVAVVQHSNRIPSPTQLSSSNQYDHQWAPPAEPSRSSQEDVSRSRRSRQSREEPTKPRRSRQSREETSKSRRSRPSTEEGSRPPSGRPSVERTSKPPRSRSSAEEASRSPRSRPSTEKSAKRLNSERAWAQPKSPRKDVVHPVPPIRRSADAAVPERPVEPVSPAFARSPSSPEPPRPFLPDTTKRLNRKRPPPIKMPANGTPGFAFGIIPDSERKRQLEALNKIDKRSGLKRRASQSAARASAEAASSSTAAKPKEEVPCPLCPKTDMPSPENDMLSPENDMLSPENDMQCPKNDMQCPKNDMQCPKNDMQCPKNDSQCPEEAEADDLDEPKAYANIWAGVHASGKDIVNPASVKAEVIPEEEEEDPYKIDAASQSSFGDDESPSKVRARHGIITLDDITASGQYREESFIFGTEAFADCGFSIRSNGRIEIQEKVSRKISEGLSDDGCVPSSNNLIFVRNLGEFQKKYRFKKNKGKKMKNLRPTLGRGAAGKVYLAIHEPTGRKLAVKEINIYDFDKREQMKKELMTLISHQSRFLVRYFGAFYDGDGGVHVALEYMDRGSLSDLVAQQGKVPEHVLRKIVEHCLRGLNFLHKNHVLHRDVKTGNILISRKLCRAKLSDFGLAVNLREKKLEKQRQRPSTEMECLSTTHSFVGTVLFMAPERLAGDEYTYASDIWGIGMCILECILGSYPFPTAGSYFDLLECAQTLPALVRASDASELLKNFVEWITCDPAFDRPTAEDLLKHPWILAGENDTHSMADWLDSLPILKCQEVAIGSELGVKSSTKHQAELDVKMRESRERGSRSSRSSRSVR